MKYNFDTEPLEIVDKLQHRAFYIVKDKTRLDRTPFNKQSLATTNL